jgi:hypothetical protein
VVATLFLVAAVMSSPNNHLGSRINAAAAMVGAIWPGVAAACVVVSTRQAAAAAAAAQQWYKSCRANKQDFCW